MNDPITLFDIGSSLHQKYVSKGSGNMRRKALKKNNAQQEKLMLQLVFIDGISVMDETFGT